MNRKVNILNEDSRSQLIQRSKRGDNYKLDQSKGRNRWERRLHSRVSHSVSTYNSINMNKLFKENILDVNVLVNGETDDYIVRMSFAGFLDYLHNQLKVNNGEFNTRVVNRALVSAFNSDQVYIHCSCLHPDTKIKLLDGTCPTVEELKERFDSGERLFAYSVDKNGDFKPGEIEKVWVTGNSSDFIKVTLDNGEYVITTPEHLYMLRDGSYIPASELKLGQSLMPLYFNVWQNGYDGIKLNSTGKYHSVYKLVADYYKSTEIQEALDRANPDNNMKYDVAIHHIDFNKHNNVPDNLQIMTAREHWDYHNKLSFINRSDEFKENVRKVASENAKKRNANPTPAMIEARKVWNAKGAARNYDEDRRQQQSEILKNIRKNETEEAKQYRQKRCREGYIKNNAAEKMSVYKKTYWESLSPEEKTAIKLKSDRNRVGQYLNSILSDGLLPTPELADKYRVKYAPKWDKCFSSWDELVTYFELNHKIVNIEYLTLSNTPVYDIKVKDYENFLVDAGVILHNCPDWKYTMAGWATRNDIDAVKGEQPLIWLPTTPPDRRRNPKDTKGAGCKHVLLVLSNNTWLMKVAMVIINYVKYMEKHSQKLYADIIYPAIYQQPYSDDVQLDMFSDDELTTDETDIDTANKYAREKGRFQKGNQSGVQFTSPSKQISIDDVEEVEDEEI